MKTYSFPWPRDKESGSVLITGLIFTAMVTLIVLSIMRGATLEERMASNSRNQQSALQAAEAVVRDAEVSLFTAPPFNPFDMASFVAACTSGYCAAPAAGSTPRWQTITWSATATTRSFATTTTLAGVVSPPRYIVELIGQEGGQTQKMCPKMIFRITGRGVGADGSEVFVESLYRHRPATFADGSCG